MDEPSWGRGTATIKWLGRGRLPLRWQIGRIRWSVGVARVPKVLPPEALCKAKGYWQPGASLGLNRCRGVFKTHMLTLEMLGPECCALGPKETVSVAVVCVSISASNCSPERMV